ncbi:MAG: hypothetical protein H0Z33_15175 [Bacillaceae bacterium]|nr:hypothetical protein [Bacillaceae bacterium]
MDELQVVNEMKNIYQQLNHITNETIRIWKEHVVFTWRWWIGLALTVIPWILWIKYRKKESTGRLLFAGFTTLIMASWFDFLGVSYGLWIYKYEVLPALPALMPCDFTLIPVIIMSLIQYKPHLNPWLKGVVYAGLTSFAGEPFFHFLGLYEPLKWNSFMSFPVYLGMFMVAYAVSRNKNFAKI